MLRDAETEKYVSGIGVHWYLNFVSAKRLSETHNRHPNKFILATEVILIYIQYIKNYPNFLNFKRTLIFLHF